MLNIYAIANSKTVATLTNESKSIVKNSITWTYEATNQRYYNTFYNIYIYPVTNVEAVRIANGDPDCMGNL